MGSNNKSIPIYLTGHSLGGGLAQHIAYVADKMVTATYAFDNSPTTNWSQLRDYEQARDPVIHRIFQEREVLERIRNAAGKFTDIRYRRTEYAFDLVKTRGVEAHSISNLTCGLAKLVKNPVAVEKNPFDYSETSAQATLKDKSLCPVSDQSEEDSKR
jgi:pimeloyl-ACP methyl ester carboxylesterase